MRMHVYWLRNRMLKEAKELGADAVINCEFEIREYADFMEVVAMGTAIELGSQCKS